MSRIVFIYAFLLIALVVLVMLSLTAGSADIGWLESIRLLLSSEDSMERGIIVNNRLPATLTAITAGICLSIAGMQMQALFRNPMAGPFVLGISTGAGLGVAILIMAGSALGWSLYASTIGNWGLILAASVGAGVLFVLILAIARVVKDLTVLLIIGLMIASAAGALTSILQMFASKADLQAFVFWTFGSFRDVQLQQLPIFILAAVPTLLLSIWLCKPMNAMLVGGEFMDNIGLNKDKITILMMVTTCILAGLVTAFCGPIAFLGLAVPHLARALFQSMDHRYLIFHVAIIGAMLALFCHWSSIVLGGGKALPINAITSLIGAPVVVWVLVSRKYKFIA